MNLKILANLMTMHIVKTFEDIVLYIFQNILVFINTKI